MDQEHRDFGRLGRRMAGWTTNGLATALILLAGLTLGRQVLVWWREAPPESASSANATAKAAIAPNELEFAALATTVQSREVRGTRADVLSQLRGLCRPASRPQTPREAAAGVAERRLLAELAEKEPADSGDGWRIDELPQEMPLVVCSTWARPTPAGSVSPLDLRIVSIGLAIPGEANRWTAYAFQLSDEVDRATAEASLPLPPDSRRVMTLRQSDGSVLTSFRSPLTTHHSPLTDPAAWQQHFRSDPSEQGWELIRQANMERGRWQAEFVKDGLQKLKATVHFEYDGQGRLSGLIHVQAQEARER